MAKLILNYLYFKGKLKHCTKTTSKKVIFKAGSRNSLGVFVDDPQIIGSMSDILADLY